MRHRFTMVALALCAAGLLCAGQAGAQDQHGEQGRAAIDKMRDRDLQPERVMDAIGLRPGMTVGEAGASYGYFTFRVSGRVGPDGVVYANDISASALESIRKRAASERVANIRTVLGDVADPRFPRRDLDVIVVFDCFFEFTDQAAWLRTARGYLKPGGRIVVVDPDRAKMASPHFLTRQRLAALAESAGLEVVAADDTFLKTHMIVALRPTR